MGSVIMKGSGPTRLSGIQIVIEPAHLALQLPMRLKSEIFSKVMAQAEATFTSSNSTEGEMMFKFPKRRLPKKCRSAIEVFARWKME